MRTNTQERDRPVIVVIGCDEIGSAVAHVLHRSGATVVLIDDIDPPYAWRGRSYVDAWYVGGATLDGIDACFCASVKSIPEILSRGEMIAATAWSLEGVANAVTPSAIVETRPRSSMQLARPRPTSLEGTRMIGVRSAHVSAWTADVVIAAAYRPDTVRAQAWKQRGDDRVPRASAVRIEAPCAGRFRTRHEISECVEAGTVLGDVGSFAAVAPTGGMLTALSARGARIAGGQVLLEIDPFRDARRCFGVTDEARDIAQHVNMEVRRLRNEPRHSGGTMDTVDADQKAQKARDLAFLDACRTAENNRLDAHVHRHMDA